MGKYMSELNFIEDFKPCGKCNKGFTIFEGRVKPCSCWLNYKNKIKLFGKYLDSNLLQKESTSSNAEELINYTLCNYKGNDENKNLPKLQKFIEKFDEKFNTISLFFYGEMGTQKTHIAKWILTSLISKGKSTYYISSKDIIDLIMKSERDEESQNLVDYITKVDCLVLDEFTRLNYFSTDYKQKVLYSWLKTRLESVHKSTIIIDNIKVDEIKNSPMGENIGQLIERNTKECVFEFKDNYYSNGGGVDLKGLWD